MNLVTWDIVKYPYLKEYKVLLALSVIAYFKIKVGVKVGVKTGILFKHL
jgi:hypothetical protein